MLQRPPRHPDEPMLGPEQWVFIVSTGVLQAVATLSVFAWPLNGRDLVEARNLALSVLVFGELFRAFAARSTTRLFGEVGAFTNVRLRESGRLVCRKAARRPRAIPRWGQAKEPTGSSRAGRGGNAPEVSPCPKDRQGPLITTCWRRLPLDRRHAAEDQKGQQQRPEQVEGLGQQEGSEWTPFAERQQIGEPRFEAN